MTSQKNIWPLALAYCLVQRSSVCVCASAWGACTCRCGVVRSVCVLEGRMRNRHQAPWGMADLLLKTLKMKDKKTRPESCRDGITSPPWGGNSFHSLCVYAWNSCVHFSRGGELCHVKYITGLNSQTPLPGHYDTSKHSQTWFRFEVPSRRRINNIQLQSHSNSQAFVYSGFAWPNVVLI